MNPLLQAVRRSTASGRLRIERTRPKPASENGGRQPMSAMRDDWWTGHWRFRPEEDVHEDYPHACGCLGLRPMPMLVSNGLPARARVLAERLRITTPANAAAHLYALIRRS